MQIATNVNKNSNGYYLFPADALNTAQSVTIEDALNGKVVDLWENGIGGIAGNVRRGRIYKVTLIAHDGKGMGWYFHGYNFDNGYNYFAV